MRPHDFCAVCGSQVGSCNRNCRLAPSIWNGEEQCALKHRRWSRATQREREHPCREYCGAKYNTPRISQLREVAFLEEGGEGGFYATYVFSFFLFSFNLFVSSETGEQLSRHSLLTHSYVGLVNIRLIPTLLSIRHYAYEYDFSQRYTHKRTCTLY